MSLLVPVHLPADVLPGSLAEFPGHLDAPRPAPRGGYVLRAETGAGPRACVSPLLKGLNVLRECRQGGVPRLWLQPAWTREFYLHLHRLLRGLPAPRCILLSPPRIADCPTLVEFLTLYRPLEAELARRKPGVRLLLENRAAQTPDEPQSLVARIQDLVALVRAAEAQGLTLGLALNLPQLFHAHFGDGPPTARQVEEVLTSLRACAPAVAALRPLADPDALFGSPELTRAALVRLREILSDGRRRYLLPADHPEPAAGMAALRRAGFTAASEAQAADG